MIRLRDEELFRVCVEGAIELIQSINLDGTLEYANPAWLQTLQFTEGDIAKITLEDYIFPGYVRRAKLSLSKALKGQQVQGFFNVLQTKSGLPIQVEGTLFPRYRNREVVGVIAIYRKVDDLSSKVDTLLHEQGRSEVVMDLISYDLITINEKIQSVFEKALADFETPPPLTNLLQEGLGEVRRSTVFISNIKELWQTARKPPQLHRYDLGECFFSAKEIVEKDFPHKRISISSKLEPGQYYVTADKFLIEIFKSLLHHITRKDARTTVQIEIDVESLLQTPFLKMQVKDHGLGMTEKEKSDILDGLAKKRIHSIGLGLDLSLARYVMENYGGYFLIEDRIENNPQDGSNFVILLRQSKETRNRDGMMEREKWNSNRAASLD